jgi:hypothetical protein
VLALGQTFIRVSIYAVSEGTPAMTPQCFRQLCMIKSLWQPGEPDKLSKTLNINGLKGISLPTELGRPSLSKWFTIGRSAGPQEFLPERNEQQVNNLAARDAGEEV